MNRLANRCSRRSPVKNGSMAVMPRTSSVEEQELKTKATVRKKFVRLSRTTLIPKELAKSVVERIGMFSESTLASAVPGLASPNKRAPGHVATPVDWLPAECFVLKRCPKRDFPASAREISRLALVARSFQPSQ